MADARAHQGQADAVGHMVDHAKQQHHIEQQEERVLGHGQELVPAVRPLQQQAQHGQMQE